MRIPKNSLKLSLTQNNRPTRLDKTTKNNPNRKRCRTDPKQRTPITTTLKQINEKRGKTILKTIQRYDIKNERTN